MSPAECIATIERVVSSCRNFKIGMTGQDVESRLSGYNGEYESVRGIYSSENEEEIEMLEQFAINHFQQFAENCDNEQVGGGEMSDRGDVYSLYVVFNLK